MTAIRIPITNGGDPTPEMPAVQLQAVAAVGALLEYKGDPQSMIELQVFYLQEAYRRGHSNGVVVGFKKALENHVVNPEQSIC